MRQVTRKSLITVAAAGGVLALGGGYAQADAGAGSTAANSPGVLSGNNVQVPVHVPVNVCGNTVDVVGVLNPAFGNKCANTSGKPSGGYGDAHGGGAHTTPAHGGSHEGGSHPGATHTVPAAWLARGRVARRERYGQLAGRRLRQQRPGADRHPHQRLRQQHRRGRAAEPHLRQRLRERRVARHPAAGPAREAR